MVYYLFFYIDLDPCLEIFLCNIHVGYFQDILSIYIQPWSYKVKVIYDTTGTFLQFKSIIQVFLFYMKTFVVEPSIERSHQKMFNNNPQGMFISITAFCSCTDPEHYVRGGGRGS